MSGPQANLPEIMLWMQALSVPILGLIAAGIAYRQWQTAERKVQLDLFDRRFAIYEASRRALHPVIREGRTDGQEITDFRIATESAFLLFGPEVVQEINEVVLALGRLAVCTGNMKSGPPYDPKDVEARSKNFIRIGDYFQNMPELIEPYMSLAQRAPGRSAAIPSRRGRKSRLNLRARIAAMRMGLRK